MKPPAGGSPPRAATLRLFASDRRSLRSFLGAVALLSASLLVAQLLAGPPVPAATAPPAALPPAPTAVSAVPYAGGRALITWQAGGGTESDSYHIEVYSGSPTGFQDQGGTGAFGDSAVVGGLKVGTPYLFAVSAVNGAGQGPASKSGTILAAGSVVPGPPSQVVLSTDGSDNQLTVTWAPSSTPVAAEVYKIGVFEQAGSSLKQVGAVNCDAPCNSMVLQARPGSITSVSVNASNSAGYTSAWSNSIAVPQPCALACLTVHSSSPGATVPHESDGFLDSNGPANPSGLSPLQWRTNLRTLSQLPNSVVTQLGGAAITDLLSDDWLDSHNLGGYAFTPWSDWSLYSQWVTDDVKSVEALASQRGFTVTYWEVQNEPFGGYYYSPSSSPPPSETISAFEHQFLVAYQAIKAADPAAQVIGPSLIAWNAQANDTPTVGIDMRSFLDFCAAHGIQLAGVSFHANTYFPLAGWYAPDGFPAQPAAIQLYVSQLRAMLAERPSLGNPAILINEYGDPYTSELPGWNVGWLSALDAAGVAGSERSCWDGCGSSLDGLLANDGSAPRPSYWVYSFYASMRGLAVPVTSSYTAVTGTASVAPNGNVSVLLGRHQTCTPAVNWSCPSYPAVPVTVNIQLPAATAATVTFAVIPAGSNTTSPLYQLSPSQATVPVINGVATVTTPSLHDGDAVEMTVTPAS